MFRHLGFTRETLRYYEEIGLLSPKRSQGSQYREFDLYDMSRLMSIDFYKKRGFSPVEMKGLLKETGTEGYDGLFQQQLDCLQEQIMRLEERLALLIESICSTGIRVSEVAYITVESVRSRKAEIYLKGKIRTILMPGKLCRKLLKYAKKERRF